MGDGSDSFKLGCLDKGELQNVNVLSEAQYSHRKRGVPDLPDVCGGRHPPAVVPGEDPHELHGASHGVDRIFRVDAQEESRLKQFNNEKRFPNVIFKCCYFL